MPLRKSPKRTPAFLAAHRANVRKSTGPRTAEGKYRLRLNALKHGGRSALFTEFIRKLGFPPGLIRQLCAKTRAPSERIGIMQMDLLRRWLARTWGPGSPRFHQFLRKVVEQERQAAEGVLRQMWKEAEGVARFQAEFEEVWGTCQKSRSSGKPIKSPGGPLAMKQSSIGSSARSRQGKSAVSGAEMSSPSHRQYDQTGNVTCYEQLELAEGGTTRQGL
ncbi:MAG TPA: hypothetical protein VMT20_29105 [Terriglobia bacterium]|nr:hypothetical protein [Terriglobia bacterium]